MSEHSRILHVGATWSPHSLSTMTPLPCERVVLLFCHGGSFTKETWTPILARLKASAMLQCVPCEFVTFDWRYHGTKRSDTDVATFYYEGGDESVPRVEHPLRHWTEWAPLELYQLTQQLKKDDATLNRTTRIVGIGHSMGATSLLKTESLYPGTFEGLVLFEPPISNAETQDDLAWVASVMVSHTLQREEQWDSWDAVLQHLKTSKASRRWHPESLAAFLDSGIIKTPEGNFHLAMPLIQEAAMYCHKIMPLSMEDFARVKCRVVFEYGSRTQFFNLELAKIAMEAFPERFSLGEPLDGCTHSLVLEDPEACARHIATDLKTFPLFTSRTSKL